MNAHALNPSTELIWIICSIVFMLLFWTSIFMYFGYKQTNRELKQLKNQ